MILTIKKFSINKDNDYEKMTSKVGQMRIFLENILSGRVPNESYSSDNLYNFCRSLIEAQRPSGPELADGSWSVSPEPSEVAEEDRIDYHYFPTFLALSLLVSCGKKDSRIPALPGYNDALRRGFEFSMSGNLEGVGFNSLFQQVESILILGSGGCFSWLADNPECCPDLVGRLRELENVFRTRLESGDTVLDFGGDYKTQFTLVCQFLKPLTS